MRKTLCLFFWVFSFSAVNEAGIGSFLKKLLNPVMELSEQVLGEAVAASVKLEYNEYKADPATLNWVNGIFDRVKAHTERDLNYNLTLLDTDIVNAFAVPGGHIFVTRGLLNKAKSDDDLAGVIGHEIGHVEAKHSMKNLQHQAIYAIIMNYVEKKTNKDISTSLDILNMFRTLKYSRENEYEADSYGVRLGAAAGYNPYGMVSFLGVLKELDPHDPSRIEVSLRTHPPTSERIKRSEELAAAYGQEVVSRPMSLTHNYGGGLPTNKQATVKKIPAKEPPSKETPPTLPAPVATKPVEVFRLNFDNRSAVSGVADGLHVGMYGGFFSMDSTHKTDGGFSQRMSNFAINRPVVLVSRHIETKGNTVYILRGKIKTRDVDGPGDHMGRGAVVVINEFAAAKFLKGHYNLGNRQGTQEFTDISYEFKTGAETNRINLEFALRNARGDAWFDEFVLEEMR